MAGFSTFTIVVALFYLATYNRSLGIPTTESPEKGKDGLSPEFKKNLRALLEEATKEIDEADVLRVLKNSLYLRMRMCLSKLRFPGKRPSFPVKKKPLYVEDEGFPFDFNPSDAKADLTPEQKREIREILEDALKKINDEEILKALKSSLILRLKLCFRIYVPPSKLPRPSPSRVPASKPPSPKPAGPATVKTTPQKSTKQKPNPAKPNPKETKILEHRRSEIPGIEDFLENKVSKPDEVLPDFPLNSPEANAETQLSELIAEDAEEPVADPEIDTTPPTSENSVNGAGTKRDDKFNEMKVNENDHSQPNGDEEKLGSNSDEAEFDSIIKIEYESPNFETLGDEGGDKAASNGVHLGQIIEPNDLLSL